MIPAKYWSPTKKLMLLGAMAGGKAVEDTATGNPLTFLTDLARPLKSLLIPFTPKQEGTGDPSPSNIRPIVPWDGLTVFNGNKNIAKFAPAIRQADREQNGIKFHYVNDSTVHIKGTATGYAYVTVKDVDTDLLLKAGKYRLSTNLERGTDNRVYLSAKNETIAYHASYAGHPVTVNLSKDYPDVTIQIAIATGTVIDSDIWVMLEVGETETSYVESNNTETDISFASPVYGGTLDAVTGVLTVEWVGKSATWGALEKSAPQQETQYKRAMLPFDDEILIAGQGGLPKNSFCNVGKYTWETSVLGEPHFYPARFEGNSYAFVFLHKDTPDETIVQAVCKLATPQEIQLTPEQITALVGNNTLWSDAAGSMTAVYFKKA